MLKKIMMEVLTGLMLSTGGVETEIPEETAVIEEVSNVDETSEMYFVEDSINYDYNYADSYDCTEQLYELMFEIENRYNSGDELTDENSFSNKLILGMEDLTLRERYTLIVELRQSSAWGHLYVSECEDLESFLKANFKG